jgi:thiamine biosynthesis lipoprotein
MKRRDFLKLLPLAPWAVGCSPPTPRIQTQGFLLYGMLIQLSLSERAPQSIESALAEVEHLFKQEYAIIHPWQDSPLTRLNARLPSGDWIDLDPALRPWIERAQALEKLSDAYFSPAAGSLVKLWGFHSGQPNQERSPPAPNAIDALMQPPPRMSDLEIDGERIRSVNPHVQLDFNAIAEGFVAQKIMTQFKSNGIHDALLDTGGDIYALGQAETRPWRVAIQNPFAEGALATLDVTPSSAIFTSGSYRKQFTYQGTRYSHVINPRTGWPSQGLVSATVITTDTLLADATATALLAAGMSNAPQLAARMGLHEVLLVDAQGGLHASPALAPRLKLVNTAQTVQMLIQGSRS